ncbi:MAG: prolipoprotein diacylglyceryl transferase [Bacteroidia bacterium]
MYPTISDLLRDLFGINIPLPIQTFGFFVALAFMGAAWTLALELRRKENEGLLHPLKLKVQTGKQASMMDFATSAVIGFIIGFKLLLIVLDYSGFVDDPQSFILSAEGNFVGGLLGAGVALFMKYRENENLKKEKPGVREETVHPYQLVGNITMVAAISGLLGAKIFDILEKPAAFLRDPIGTFFSFSGLTMYGGLIVGGVAVIWYTRKKGIHWRHIIDTAAPGLMLAYGIGRIGCHMSGDGDWGIVNNNPKPAALSWLPDWTWAFDFPHNVIDEGVPIPGCVGKHCMVLPEPVYPTSLYESVISIGLFLVLWSFRKNLEIPGMMFSIYLILNGIERFFIEKIRVNVEYNFLGGITQAELISVLLVILGIAGIIYFNKNREINKI